MDYRSCNFLTLLVSLGLFLYGTKVMTAALIELGCDRMRNILAKDTDLRGHAYQYDVLMNGTIDRSVRDHMTSTEMTS